MVARFMTVKVLRCFMSVFGLSFVRPPSSELFNVAGRRYAQLASHHSRLRNKKRRYRLVILLSASSPASAGRNTAVAIRSGHYGASIELAETVEKSQIVVHSDHDLLAAQLAVPGTAVIFHFVGAGVVILTARATAMEVLLPTAVDGSFVPLEFPLAREDSGT